MKKILYILLLTTIFSYSQEKQIIKIGLDPNLAINGAYSYDSNPVLDLHLTLLTQLENGFEGGLSIEYANLKPTYSSIGFVFNKKINVINSTKTETLIGVETSLLFRDFIAPKRQLWLTGGINTEFRYYVLEKVGIALRYNYKYRPDYNTFKQNGTIELFITF